MPDILEQLRQKEETLATFRSKEVRRQGREEQLLKQLKTDYSLDTIDQAVVLQEQLQAQQDEREEGLKALDTEMGNIIAAAKSPEGDTSCG